MKLTLFYKVEFGNLKGTLQYRLEKRGYRGTDVPLVFVGDPAKAFKYSEITSFLLNSLKKRVNNDEREIVKLIREFSNTGHLPRQFDNLSLRFELEEKLSAFALIAHISEEARTPGTGSATWNLLKELYSPSPNSFLDIAENSMTHRLKFSEIFDTKEPLLSYMSPRGKDTGADVWRKKHFGTSDKRLKQYLAKKNLANDIDLFSGDERQLAASLNSNDMSFQSPLRRPKNSDLDSSMDSSRKRRSAGPSPSSLVITKKKGPSWKKSAAIAIPILFYLGPPAAAIVIPIAICATIQWFKNRSQGTRSLA